MHRNCFLIYRFVDSVTEQYVCFEHFVELLNPRGNVHRLSNQGIGETVRAADIGSHSFACMQTNTVAEEWITLFGQRQIYLRQSLAYLQKAVKQYPYDARAQRALARALRTASENNIAIEPPAPNAERRTLTDPSQRL